MIEVFLLTFQMFNFIYVSLVKEVKTTKIQTFYYIRCPSPKRPTRSMLLVPIYGA